MKRLILVCGVVLTTALTGAGCDGGGGGGAGGPGSTSAPPPAQQVASPAPTPAGPANPQLPAAPPPANTPTPAPSPPVATPPPPPTSPPPPSGPTSVPAPYTPSQDTVKIYVSSSGGDDANSGLSPNLPKRTIAAGYALLRSGYPDWLLLKRGDTFTGGFGDWKKTGRSGSQPMVVWSYGAGTTRPKLLTGTGYGVRCQPSSGTPTLVHSVCFVGLHFYAHTRDPDGGSYTGPAGTAGVHWLRHSRDIVFDDMKIESHANGINVQNYEGTGVDRVTIRRCVIIDSYNTQAHSQGAFISGVSNLVVEDNVFDKNGWNESVPGAEPTIYNHNLYLQVDCDLNVMVRRNVFTRAASHGCQLRSGGTFERNFMFRNPINFQAGYDAPPPPPGATCAIRDNVILEGCDISEDLPRGWGINFKPIDSCTVERNLVAHVRTTSGNRRAIEVKPNVTYSQNKIYDWSVNTNQGWGETLFTPGPWSEPNRTVTGYCQSRGLPGTVDAFYQRLRAQSRDAWDPAFSAESLNAYFLAGFTPPQ